MSDISDNNPIKNDASNNIINTYYIDLSNNKTNTDNSNSILDSLSKYINEYLEAKNRIVDNANKTPLETSSVNKNRLLLPPIKERNEKNKRNVKIRNNVITDSSINNTNDNNNTLDEKNNILNNNKDNDNYLDIRMKIRDLIRRIRSERKRVEDFNDELDKYRNEIHRSINDTSNNIKNDEKYKDFTRTSNRTTTNRYYKNLINSMDFHKRTYQDRGVSTEDKNGGDISNNRPPISMSEYNKNRISNIRKFMNATDTNYYTNKYNSSSYHGIKPDKPIVIKSFGEITGNMLFSKEREMIEKSNEPVVKKKVNIEVEIECIGDLLKLTEEYPIQYDIEYNINMEAIHNIKEPLTKLDNMIGMQSLKSSIVDQVLYFIQGLHKIEQVIEVETKDRFGRVTGVREEKVNRGCDFMHTCIYGPPGTGKTEVAKIMGSIFSKLGVLKNNIFKKVTRADLIAGYLGQTAMKTRDMVKECLGGVMFIDEAYALGNAEKRDSFAKECIDTLCEALSDHKEELMVIIAGYEKELEKCFFSYNQGLDSRFTWRFKTDDYSAEELRLIFLKKIKDAGWKVEKDNVDKKWFEDNKSYFKFYGRDMENLFSKVKIAHSRRVFCLPPEKKKIVNNKDLEKGLGLFLTNDEVKKRKEDKEKFQQLYYKMYT